MSKIKQEYYYNPKTNGVAFLYNNRHYNNLFHYAHRYKKILQVGTSRYSYLNYKEVKRQLADYIKIGDI